MASRDLSDTPGLRRDTLYRALFRHALVRVVFIYFTPLLLLSMFFHVQYRSLVRDIEQRHLESMAEHQAGLLDLYLGDRFLNLTSLTGDTGFLLDPRPERLQRNLDELRLASEAFVDLAVLDEQGRVLGYAGPLPDLVDMNYAQQAWFGRLLAGRSAHVITDVYLGFRGEPHYTMALKQEPQGRVRILRATLSPEITQAHMQVLYPSAAEEQQVGLMANLTTNIWLFAALFCLIGGVVIWLQSRWVAKQQLDAVRVEESLSRQLIHASKLASVGELAAGVAHEINNPLAVILEKVGLVQDLLDPRFKSQLTDEILKDHLVKIERAIFRCTDITRQLLGFVRQTEVELKETDVALLIDNLIDNLMGPELDVADIDVIRDYDPGLPPVVTDPGQLRQVILNLLKNAADAIDRDGTITITTSRREDRFSLTIADTGCGMTPDQMEKVFMPFYTTKSRDKGTGLGLSVSYGIVKGLGGEISVRSEAGRGSEFTLDLPLRR